MPHALGIQTSSAFGAFGLEICSLVDTAFSSG